MNPILRKRSALSLSFPGQAEKEEGVEDVREWCRGNDALSHLNVVWWVIEGSNGTDG